MEVLLRGVYSLVTLLCLPLLIGYFFFRSIKAPHYRRRIAERFAFVPVWQRNEDKKDAEQANNNQSAYRPRIWLHTVSVGEFLGAKHLCRELLSSGYELYLTSTTPTGSEQIMRFANEHDPQRVAIRHSYMPYDLGLLIRRFLQRIKPDITLFMETEIWPNTLAELAHQSVPSGLINARLSERSAKSYARFGVLIRETIARFDLIAVAEQPDLLRLQGLGARPDTVHLTGNIKSTIRLTELQKRQARQLRAKCGYFRPFCIIAASTHENEEDLVLNAARKTQLPHTLIILVPRHPERFESVYARCRQQGFSPLRYTDIERLEARHDVIVVNQLGVLAMLYGAADLAFIGGSLVPVGGHNSLEAAVWGLPLLTGPHYHNFASVSEALIARNAIRVVQSEQELVEQFRHFYHNVEDRFNAGAAALKYMEEQPDALNATQLLIERTLNTAACPKRLR